MQRTIKCRMDPTPVMGRALAETAKAFASACNTALGYSRRLKTSNKVKLQHAAYREIRSRHGLTANLAVRAIARVAYAVKIAAKRHKGHVREFKPSIVDYDARIFAYRHADETVSVSTVEGRMHIPLRLGRFQREALAGKTPTCARVVRGAGFWDIHIVVEEIDPPKRGGPPLGIDCGIKSIAALSTDTKISGAKIRSIKERYARVRASLQSKRTRGANRVLRRLSGKERRFISTTNHKLSKDVIRRHAVPGGFGVIRIEDLRGIRGRTRSRSKHLNRMISGWSFGEFQSFLRYKAERAGLTVEAVNPAWTSQTCADCGRRGGRDGDVFSCQTCGTRDADRNAARVIAAGGVGAGEIPADCNATRIGDRLVGFFGSSHAG